MINVNYEPINQIQHLAMQAGSNDAAQRAQEIEVQTQMAAMAHDDAMRRMEFQAQTQVDSQYREFHFQKALQGDQLQKQRLTLDQQYAYNIKLDQAKADMDMQNHLKNYSQYTAQLDAAKQAVYQADNATDTQKDKAFEMKRLELASVYGITGVEKVMERAPRMGVEQIGGKTYNVAYGDMGEREILGESAKAVPGQMTEAQSSAAEDRLSMNIERKKTDLDKVAMTMGAMKGQAKISGQEHYDSLKSDIAKDEQKLRKMQGDTQQATSSPPDAKLSPYWDKLSPVEQTEVTRALMNNPNNITEILRRLQHG